MPKKANIAEQVRITKLDASNAKDKDEASFIKKRSKALERLQKSANQVDKATRKLAKARAKHEVRMLKLANLNTKTSKDND